jgi:hypothetical protein
LALQNSTLNSIGYEIAKAEVKLYKAFLISHVTIIPYVHKFIGNIQKAVSKGFADAADGHPS